MNSAAVQRATIASQVESAVASTPASDIHTHLYDPAFGPLLLWGIDDLLVHLNHRWLAEMSRAVNYVISDPIETLHHSLNKGIPKRTDIVQNFAVVDAKVLTATDAFLCEYVPPPSGCGR